MISKVKLLITALIYIIEGLSQEFTKRLRKNSLGDFSGISDFKGQTFNNSLNIIEGLTKALFVYHVS